MGEVAEVLLRIKLDGSDANRGLSQLIGQLQGMGAQVNSSVTPALTGASQAMGALGGSISAAAMSLAGAASGAAAFTGAIAAAASAVKEFAHAEQISAKVEAVLHATGHAAGLTKRQLDDMAKALSAVSGVEDEVISNAQAVLLTFRNIRGEAFERTTRAALDLSAVMGGDLQSSIVQLGRALQDAAAGETAGLTALRRAGISFTDAQVQMIKKLGESGDAAKAMAVVLNEVEREVGGAAERMGSTVGGELAKLTVAWGNLKEALGENIVALGVTDVIRGLTAVLTDGQVAMEAFVATARDLSVAGQLINTAFRAVTGTEWLSSMAGVSIGEEDFSQLTKRTWENTYKRYRQMADTTKAQLAAAAPESAEAARLNKLLDEQAAVLQRLHAARKEVYGRAALEEAAAARAEEEAAAARAKKAAEEAEKAAKKAAEEQAKAAKKRAEEQARALAALLDYLDPAAKRLREFRDAEALLADRLAAGAITQDQYTEAMERLRAKVAQAKAEFAQAPMTVDQTQDYIDKTIDRLSGVMTGTNWQVAFDKVFEQAGRSLGQAIQWGMADTFRTLAQHGDVKDALETFAADVSGIFSQAIATGLMDALFGYHDEQGNWISGDKAFSERFGKLSRGEQIGVGLASMAGQYLYSSGMQRGDRGQAALGGAMTGAATGFTVGNVIGAVIGAIVGGVAAYFMSGSKSTDYHFWGELRKPMWFDGMSVGGGWAGMYSDVTGYGDLEESEMSKKIVQQYRTLSTQFREILFLLEQPLGDWKTISIEMRGSAGDFNTVMKHLLDSKIPAELVDAYRDTLTAGLEALGVTQQRANELLNAFKTMDPTEAMAQLKQFVTAIVEGAQMLEKLGVGTPALVELANAGAWQKYASGYAEATGQIDKYMVGLGELSPEELLRRFDAVSGIISQQYTAALEILQQIGSIRSGITSGWEQFQAGRALTVAQRGGLGDFASFVTTRFQDTLDQVLGSASGMNLEEVQKAWQDLQQWGQALSQVADQLEDLLPQFDALTESLGDLDSAMSVSLEDRWADLAKDSQARFFEATGEKLAEVQRLRDTLADLGAPELLNSVTRMRDLASEAFELANQNLQAIYAASQNVASTYATLWAGWDEAEAKKAGPKQLGEYYVDQLMKLQDQLRGATSPEEIQAINTEIAKYAQALYGMDEQIKLQLGDGSIVDVLDWLRPWTKAQEEFSQQQLAEWKKANQGVVDQFKDALSGLTTVLDTEKTNLETTIAALRALIDEQMGGAVNALVTRLNELETAVGDNVTALGLVLETLLAFLGTGAPPVPKTNQDPRIPRRRIGLPGGGSDEGEPPPPGPPPPDIQESDTLLGAINGLTTGTTSLNAVVEDLAEQLEELKATVAMFAGTTLTVELDEGLLGSANTNALRIISRGGVM